MNGRDLDDSQRTVVEIPASKRQIVIAGPGSGKTEVVSSLVEHLIDNEGVDPTDGTLVISFSNSAVHAVDARSRTPGKSPVTVQTIDSFAAEILRDLAIDSIEQLGFDGRIAMAGELLADGGWDRILDLKHLVVDEAQDIVGVRADLLQVILEGLSEEAGFTLLGDPAQGIYDFQTRPDSEGRRPRSTTTSTELLSAIADLSGVETRPLTGQYRAVSKDAKAAADLQAAFHPGRDPSLVDDFHSGLVPIGTVDDVLALAERWQGTTAFLTSTNGQALLLAGELRERGVTVEIRRSAQQRVVAPWVARLLHDASAATVSREELDARVAERAPELESTVLWRALRGVAGGRGSEVDLPRLMNRLRAQRPLAPELIDHLRTSVVVSTVHRAKGLEFDNVVLVDFLSDQWFDDATTQGERLRARFVALTRARRLIARADGPDDRFVRRSTKAGLNAERWYRSGPRAWMTFGFEIGVNDIEPITAEIPVAQEHLASRVAAGDALEFKIDPDSSTLTIPVYAVSHRGLQVGRTTREFGEDLASRIGTLEAKKGPWPTLYGAHVESVASVVTDPTKELSTLRRLLLVPVTSGLLHIKWKV